MTEWQEARIDSIEAQTPRVKVFVLRPKVWHSYLPGQHIDVRLTAPDSYEARRSYSLTSAPGTRDTLEIAVERLVDGEVSSWFHDVAQVGDTIDVSGPFTEHFVWRGEPDAPVLLVAGGSGVAPFLSMVRHRANIADAPPMQLLYSARAWSEVICGEELLRQEASQRGLQVSFCLTRETARRPADFGRRIDADVLRDVLSRMVVPPQQTFVCGNNRFVEAVANALVVLGVPAPTIRTERYGGD